MEKICIIGLGNMGNAMFGILSRSDQFEVLGCEKSDPINKYLEESDTCIIAVKPQDFEDLCKSISIDLEDKLVVSIMAGVSLERIERLLGAKKVVRVMPNLPLRIQKSMSGWIANKNVDDKDKKIIRQLLSEFGAEVEVDKEEKINIITALSGSGPAYFFRLTEILASAAKKYGFNEENARKIAENTFLGAAELLTSSKESSTALREKVTSKGGTTEAAFESMNSNNIEKIVLEGIEAARRRADELNS